LRVLLGFLKLGAIKVVVWNGFKPGGHWGFSFLGLIKVSWDKRRTNYSPWGKELRKI